MLAGIVSMVAPDQEPVTHFLRRLIGSNCILIERGDVPPYYDCIGCVIEEASGCLDDMRTNKSYNVAGDCRINSLKSDYDESCCPTFGINQFGVKDLRYVGSAYPETLRCMERLGCGGSVLYSQLKAECMKSCPFKDPRNSGPVCMSAFNSANSIHSSLVWTVGAITLMSMYIMSNS